MGGQRRICCCYHEPPTLRCGPCQRGNHNACEEFHDKAMSALERMRLEEIGNIAATLSNQSGIPYQQAMEGLLTAWSFQAHKTVGHVFAVKLALFMLFGGIVIGMFATLIVMSIGR